MIFARLAFVGQTTKSEGEVHVVAGLTRSFKETVQRRVEGEPEFRQALLVEAVDCFVAGEVDVGKTMLRDFINATVGFEVLCEAVGTPAKSLMRMLSPDGNPTAKNLFAVISELQLKSDIQLSVIPAATRV